MIVLDASVAIDLLLDLPPRAERARDILASGEAPHAPHLLDAEVGQTLRGWMLKGAFPVERARSALDDLADLPIVRYPHGPLLPAALELASRLTVYDALYVVLAMGLDAPLLTGDRGVARAAGSYGVLL